MLDAIGDLALMVIVGLTVYGLAVFADWQIKERQQAQPKIDRKDKR